jgi:hypothetical protein
MEGMAAMVFMACIPLTIRPPFGPSEWAILEGYS